MILESCVHNISHLSPHEQVSYLVTMVTTQTVMTGPSVTLETRWAVRWLAEMIKPVACNHICPDYRACVCACVCVCECVCVCVCVCVYDDAMITKLSQVQTATELRHDATLMRQRVKIYSCGPQTNTHKHTHTHTHTHTQWTSLLHQRRPRGQEVTVNTHQNYTVSVVLVC